MPQHSSAPPSRAYPARLDRLEGLIVIILRRRGPAPGSAEVGAGARLYGCVESYNWPSSIAGSPFCEWGTVTANWPVQEPPTPSLAVKETR